jgi:ADP-ribose pyrophosphatase YjhB (NUDIX family)
MKTHCIHCGEVHTQENYPKKCSHCGTEMYKNPIPVAVVVVPVEEGILLIQRNIPPQVGGWAFPGGFVDEGETVLEAAQRELQEEVGVNYQGDFSILSIESTPNRANMLIFVKANQGLKPQDLINFKPNSEVQALKVIKRYEDLCFPLHSLILHKIFG